MTPEPHEAITASSSPTSAALSCARGSAAGNSQTSRAAFAPADAPKIAIAVVVENQAGGFGGTVAAPIAKQVMEALLR